MSHPSVQTRRLLLTAVILIPYVASSGADDAILEDGAEPKLVAEGAGEGPAWHPELGVLFSGHGGTGRMDRDGKVSMYRADSGTNGLLFDRKGRLICCEAQARRVTRVVGDTTIVFTDQYEGMKYNQPNDLTIDSQGRIYFSDPRYGDRSSMELKDENGKLVEGVYRIDPNNKVTRVITHEADRPNGLLVTPDDKYLYVADNNNNDVGGARKLWRFDLQPDGSVKHSSRKLVFDWGTDRGPDGMAIDTQGRLFVAGGLNKPHPPAETADKFKAGVYVFSPEGKLLLFIPIPRDEVTNCAFGGDDLKSLYITGGGTLWSVRVKTPGRLVWPKARG